MLDKNVTPLENTGEKIVEVKHAEEQRVNCCSHCHSQVLEFLQGLLRREHIDQTDDLQAQRQAISPLGYSPIYTHFSAPRRAASGRRSSERVCLQTLAVRSKLSFDVIGIVEI